MEELDPKAIEAEIEKANQLRGEAIGKMRELTKYNPLQVEAELMDWALVAHKNYLTIRALRKLSKEVRARKREAEAEAILSKYD